MSEQHFDEFGQHHHHDHHEHGGAEESHHGGGGDHHHQSNGSSSSSTTGDNGFVVVPQSAEAGNNTNNNHVSSTTTAASVESGVLNDALASEDKQEELSRMLADISSTLEAKVNSIGETIRAEADSSSSHAAESPAAAAVVTPSAPAAPSAKSGSEKPAAASSCSSNASFLCPYYLMAMDRLSKVEIPPKVKDLLLWKNPKVTGALFGSALVLLISIASFSLLTVVSALFLTALTLIGSYRFYLALIYRIKGTYDNTFDKWSAQDVSLPKDKVQNLARLLESDFNRSLNKLKSILLWDNITTSGIAFFAFYVIYCIGCMFNTVTLLILALVSAFTLPKVYDVYKQPIDQGIEKGTAMVHQTVKQVMKKVPMLNKKKTQ